MNRKKIISMRVTEKEDEIINKSAKILGLTKSQLLRKALREYIL